MRIFTIHLPLSLLSSHSRNTSNYYPNYPYTLQVYLTTILIVHTLCKAYSVSNNVYHSCELLSQDPCWLIKEVSLITNPQKKLKKKNETLNLQHCSLQSRFYQHICVQTLSWKKKHRFRVI